MTLIRVFCVALIRPRSFQLQAGASDDDEHRDGAVTLVPHAAAFYRNLKQGGSFEFVLSACGHEFHDRSAWAFLEKHL